MRTAGGYPDYPLPSKAAGQRLRVLETRITRIEALLAREPTDERWAERDGWVEERDLLLDAFATLNELLPSLPRCGCGKLVHETLVSAEAHFRMMQTINDRPPSQRDQDQRLNIYVCKLRRIPAYHVGHSYPQAPTTSDSLPSPDLGRPDAPSPTSPE